LLIVGGRPEDAVWFGQVGLVACVVGEGDWRPGLAQMRENPVIEGDVAVWQGGRVWVGEDEAEAEEAATAGAAFAFVRRRLVTAPDEELAEPVI